MIAITHLCQTIFINLMASAANCEYNGRTILALCTALLPSASAAALFLSLAAALASTTVAACLICRCVRPLCSRLRPCMAAARVAALLSSAHCASEWEVRHWND